jgi:hypothetical protein
VVETGYLMPSIAKIMDFAFVIRQNGQRFDLTEGEILCSSCEAMVMAIGLAS